MGGLKPPPINCLCNPRLPNTLLGGMTGPQKHAKQTTVHLRRYLEAYRAPPAFVFCPCSHRSGTHAQTALGFLQAECGRSALVEVTDSGGFEFDAWGARVGWSKKICQVIQFVTFLSPIWRSRFNHPKKITKNCQVGKL